MSKPRPIYKPGTTRFAGSIGEGRDTLPGALAPTASAPVAATPAPALSDLLTVLRFRTSATGDQAPTAQERAVAAAAVTDWFAACTRDGDSAVWWNARSGHWQAVAEDGVQAVWI
ncbi:MAG: hypothetical protein QG597_4007, partial [Actinomycetota bacterium]|nr:hypothetical protein [Actinomycetota bacterium]